MFRFNRSQQRLINTANTAGNAFAAAFPIADVAQQPAAAPPPAAAAGTTRVAAGTRTRLSRASTALDTVNRSVAADAFEAANLNAMDIEPPREDAVADAAPPVEAAHPRPVPAARVNANLESIRARFNPAGILASSRSKSTFNNHQRENTKLILYLFENSPELLNDQFCHDLHDEEASIDYSRITHPPRGYRYKGTKSVEERIECRRQDMMRQYIGSVLGGPGTVAQTQTVDLDAFTSDPEIFVRYIMTKVKENGQMMKPQVYASYRSNLSFLFKRYRYRPVAGYSEFLTEYMEGTKRLANEDRANGGVSNIFAIPIPHLIHTILILMIFYFIDRGMPTMERQSCHGICIWQ